MEKSKRFELSKYDYLAIWRNILIIYSPVIYLFLEQIEKWAFDYKIIVALAISTTIDTLRRYFKDYTK